MQHLGEILRTCIRDKGLKQKEIADKAGITAAYLVNILKKKSIDCELWERLCEATGIDPIVAFSPGGSASTYISGVSAATVIGQASVNIGSEPSKSVWRRVVSITRPKRDSMAAKITSNHHIQPLKNVTKSVSSI